MSDATFLVTCEHAGNRVPAAYRTLFTGHAVLLASHHGWDRGARALARALASRVGAPLIETTVSRLVVDTNRSLHHRALFSERTRGLPMVERARIVERHWRPLREAALDAIRAATVPVVHLSAHSFTPVLDGVVRDIDVGFLYDPGRTRERGLVGGWVRALRARRPDLRVRRNAPYRGVADGHTSALRRVFPDATYAGVEIEVNQAITTGAASSWRRLRAQLVDVIAGS